MQDWELFSNNKENVYFYLEYLDPVHAFSVKMGHTTINAEQQYEAWESVWTSVWAILSFSFVLSFLFQECLLQFSRTRGEGLDPLGIQNPIP